MASGRRPPACKAATACRRRPPPRSRAGPGARAASGPGSRAAPRCRPSSAAPTSEKVTFAADAFFDFDKSVLKPEGKAKLDDLVSKMSGLNLEVIIAVGHTDSVGGDAYNQKLSVRRSEAVKSYLVSKGVEKNRVYTEGKGEKQPVADNKTAEGRAKNRRVEIEVVGTRGRSKRASTAHRKPRLGGVFCFCVRRFDVRLVPSSPMINADPQELAKFSELAHRWWDPESEFRPAAPDQPAAPRLDRRPRRACDGKRVLDVGCGGGILAECDGAARRRGARHRPGRPSR